MAMIFLCAAIASGEDENMNETNGRNAAILRHFRKSENSLASTTGDRKKYLRAPPACANSSGAKKLEFILAKRISFAMNTIVQTCFGAMGLAGNTVAAGILASSKRLNSTFNQILVCNLVLQTLYIISCIIIEVYKLTEAAALHHFFSFFLYPCKPMLLYASTMLTVLMARERSLAVSSPLSYRARTMTEGQWRRAMAYTVASVGLSSLFVLPLVWESEVVLRDVARATQINSTHSWVSDGGKH